LTFQIPIHKTVTFNKSFQVYSIRLMNNLDREIRLIESDKTFSNNNIRKLFLERYD